MYNRYIPGQNGLYQRQVIKEASCDMEEPTLHQSAETKAQPCDDGSNRKPQPFADSLDLGDLLLLCVLLLLLLDADQNDMLSLFITAVAFILLQ